MLSSLMWLLYLYLIQDGLLDAMGLVQDTYEWTFSGAERPNLPTLTRFRDTLRNYGVVIVANGVLLVVWALYNRARFSGADRRQAATPVSIDDLALLYARPAAEIAAWQSARILTMTLAEDGTLVEVTTR